AGLRAEADRPGALRPGAGARAPALARPAGARDGDDADRPPATPQRARGRTYPGDRDGTHRLDPRRRQLRADPRRRRALPAPRDAEPPARNVRPRTLPAHPPRRDRHRGPHPRSAPAVQRQRRDRAARWYPAGFEPAVSVWGAGGAGVALMVEVPIRQGKASAGRPALIRDHWRI